MNGFIHSIETFGTLDGPGIRMVVFMQGCPLRCKFCHNPDTWQFSQGECKSAQAIVEQAKKYKNYYKKGGITFSGGEPLAQDKFLKECLVLSKQEGFHTAIDTSGLGKGNYDEILDFTDLVILDIKGTDEKEHRDITGVGIRHYLNFKDSLLKKQKHLWLKRVVVPTINDSFEHMDELAKEIKSYDTNLVEKIELLPYHTLGLAKYKEMNIEYPLKGIAPMEEGKLVLLKEYLKEKCSGYNVV